MLNFFPKGLRKCAFHSLTGVSINIFQKFAIVETSKDIAFTSVLQVTGANTVSSL